MTSGKGLGKGLGALFGEQMEVQGGVSGIKLLDIEPNPNQPRREFDAESMSQLEDSIRQNGVITPITVRKDGSHYIIIAGERRWRAARAAGLSEIPAYVMDIKEDEAYQLALIENLQRQDLNPIEEAQGFEKLIGEYGLSQDQAAGKVGRSRPYVTNSLRLLTLPAPIREMVAAGALTAGHGRALVTLDEKQAMEAAKIILERELSVRETEKLVKRMTETPPEENKKESAVAMYISQLEHELASETNHAIKINHGRKKGRLTIEYYGNEDLEQICTALRQMSKTND